jgi:hypothetical protein
LVPRPRLHLIRFHGVLGPNAKLRALVVPHAPEPVAKEAMSCLPLFRFRRFSHLIEPLRVPVRERSEPPHTC